MANQRQLFLQHVAQTSQEPPAFEFISADGIYLFDRAGNKFVDLISGIAVSSLGHGNAKVIEAIRRQAEQHLHLMVYGEYIVSPQVSLAKKLADQLPDTLHSIYFTGSGTEATEGAMKLAKRYTGRYEFVSFNNAYHGSTQGALSLSGSDFLKNGYHPLLPGCKHIPYNSLSHLEEITDKTAAVFIEPVQAEAGVLLPEQNFLKKVRERCNTTGALMVMDEIQTGMGRTGRLFCFDEDCVPDILLVGKSFGAGMPLAAFISSQKIMHVLTYDPVLGHITTFGGHPVSCAAAEAALDQLTEEKIIEKVKDKEQLFLSNLKHEAFRNIRSKGLLMSIELENEKVNRRFIRLCYDNGLVTDWFLFAPHCTRLAPPLIISDDEIKDVCRRLIKSADELLM